MHAPDRDSSPTARALLTLELVQASPGITADRLADRLGVSKRAARRYVGILREAGIPVESVRGPYGGYRIGRGIRLPPLMFSAAEARPRGRPPRPRHHHGPRAGLLEPPARAARLPLRGRVGMGRRGRSLGGRRPPRAVVPAVPLPPPAMPGAHTGSTGSAAWRRSMTPSAPPADLDPVAVLEEHLADGWEYDVEVVVDAPVDAVAPCVTRAIGRLEPVDAHTTRLVGSTSNPVWYAEQLAAIPARYRIVRCPELEEADRALGRRLLAAGG